MDKRNIQDTLVCREEDCLSSYKAWLEQRIKNGMSIDDVIDACYEYKIRRGIVTQLGSGCLEEKQLINLYSCPDPVNQIYREYARKEAPDKSDSILGCIYEIARKGGNENG